MNFPPEASAAYVATPDKTDVSCGSSCPAFFCRKGEIMDLVKDGIGRLYRRYLGASMVSAVVMTVYSMVDTVAIGRSEGAAGTAAMAVITPMYGMCAFSSILCGVGGAVLYGNARGEGKRDEANGYFTASAALMLAVTLLFWGTFALFRNQILTFFGADAALLPKVMEYMGAIGRFLPAFLLSMFLGAFVRNDGAPGRAMAAVIIGGCVNMLGDWLLVFPLGMGMRGAAIATVTGTFVQLAVLCSHFLSKRCTLRLVRPGNFVRAAGRTLATGFGAAALELGTAFLTILTNSQINRYGGMTALAVYGVVVAVSTLFQSMFNGVGQAIQPIVSANHGAGETLHVRRAWRMALLTVICMGLAFTTSGILFPRQIVGIYVDGAEAVMAAPGIVRPYFLAFLFMGVNIAATYYLQSVLRRRMSLLVAAARGVAVSGLLLIALPPALGIMGVWLAVPLAEMIVAAVALTCIRRRGNAECRCSSK